MTTSTDLRFEGWKKQNFLSFVTWKRKTFVLKRDILHVHRTGEKTPYLSFHMRAADVSDVEETRDGKFAFVVKTVIGDLRDMTIATESRGKCEAMRRALRFSGLAQDFISPEAVTIKELIGRGASGRVYRADYFGAVVAVKRIVREKSSACEENIMDEVRTVRSRSMNALVIHPTPRIHSKQLVRCAQTVDQVPSSERDCVHWFVPRRREESHFGRYRDGSSDGILSIFASHHAL